MTTVEDNRLPTRRVPPRHAASVLLLVGTLWVAVASSGVVGSAEAVTFVGLSVVAIVSIVTGVVCYRPALRRPWVLILAALVLFLVAGVLRQETGSLGDLTSHRSLVPDLFALPGYVLLALALADFGRARRRGRPGDFDASLDATIAALAVLSLAWTSLASPVFLDSGTPLHVKAVLASYPAMSVFLVALCARIAFSAGGRSVVAYRYLFAAMGMMLLGDCLYMLVDTGLVNVAQQLADAPYALAYVCCAAGALHPSMRDLTEPMPAGDVAPKTGRLALVAVALGVPALLAIVRHDSSLGDRLVLAGVVVALTTAATWRVARALRAHARSEAVLAHQATHDPLTQLPNRFAVEDHLARVLRGERDSSGNIALLFLDLDRFKLLNDTMGHTAGDELLVAVAGRLQRRLRPGDLVARVGGDEFVVVLDAVDLDAALSICEELRATLEAPFALRGGEVFTSVSVGVAFAATGPFAIDAETAIREADTAMYQAKDAGRNQVAVYDGSMRERLVERLTLEHDLRLALERGELRLAFQPIVRLPGGPFEGAEALLRWQHPTKGEISPVKFVPIAEESGLIVDIGRWVMHEACHHLARWRRNGEVSPDFSVSVNLSARQLRDPDLLESVRHVLAKFDLPPAVLSLELTESMLMDEPDRSREDLEALRDLGVQLAIDDFGTGYSSLAYIQRFPAQTVKIDRVFVMALDDADSSEESLVAAIVAMARALGMRTVAEGVETAAQEARLVDLGCAAAQGYYYSRPIPPEALPAALGRYSTPMSSVGD